MTSHQKAVRATRTKAAKGQVTSAPEISARKVSHDLIAIKAHELWLNRGLSHGSDWSDWFEAERLLRK